MAGLCGIVVISHSSTRLRAAALDDRIKNICINVLRARRRLLRLQCRDGRWATANEIARITATCQAILALKELGLPEDERQIQGGIAWLQRHDVATSEYSYWRALPFVVCGHEEAARKELVRLRDLCGSGLQPNPNLSVKVFSLYCHCLMNAVSDDFATSVATEIVERSLKLPLERADNVGFALMALTSMKQGVLEKALFENALNHIAQRATGNGEFRCWEGNLTSTSFVIINLCSSNTADHDAVRDTLDRAANHVSAHLFAKARLPDDLPYGGAFTDEAYFLAIRMRALIVYARAKNSDVNLMLASCGQSLAEERTARHWMIGSTVLTVATFAVIGWQLVTSSLSVASSIVTIVTGTPMIVGWIKTLRARRAH